MPAQVGNFSKAHSRVSFLCGFGFIIDFYVALGLFLAQLKFLYGCVYVALGLLFE
jgi:hypothetical protein